MSLDEMEGIDARVESSALSTITKAEIDVAISTAKAYPRSISKFRDEVKSMCTLNDSVAEECLYVLERTDSKTGKKVEIEGPSIRMAEIVLSCWQNCRVMGRVLDDGGEFIVGQGVFFDLQRNVTVSKEVRRRITNKEGRRYSADMIQVTGMAAVSIAIRNAIFGGIPGAFWAEAYEKAKEVAAGTIETLEIRRRSAIQYCADRGVSEDRIFAYLGVAGIEDIGLDALVRLRTRVGMIKTRELTAEEAFPSAHEEEKPAEPPKRGMKAVKAAILKDALVGAEINATATKGGTNLLIGIPAREILPAQQDAYPPCSRCTSEAQVRSDGVLYCFEHEPKPAPVVDQILDSKK